MNRPPRRKRRRHKPRRRRPRNNQKPAIPPVSAQTAPNPPRRLWPKIRLLGGIGIALGLAQFLWPQINVSLESSLDSSNTFRQPIRVTNASYLPISDVRFFCCLNKVQVVAPNNSRYFIDDSSTEYMGARTRTLRRLESRTIMCGAPSGAALSADIALVVSYLPWPGLFYRIKRIERFVGTPGADKVLHLYSQPSDPIRDTCLRHVEEMESSTP